MSLQLIITPDADHDIDQTCDWYEERQAGIGRRFVLAVRLRYEDILRSPLLPRAFGWKAIRKVRVPHTGLISFTIESSMTLKSALLPSFTAHATQII